MLVISYSNRNWNWKLTHIHELNQTARNRVSRSVWANLNIVDREKELLATGTVPLTRVWIGLFENSLIGRRCRFEWKFCNYAAGRKIDINAKLWSSYVVWSQLRVVCNCVSMCTEYISVAVCVSVCVCDCILVISSIPKFFLQILMFWVQIIKSIRWYLNNLWNKFITEDNSMYEPNRSDKIKQFKWFL